MRDFVHHRWLWLFIVGLLAIGCASRYRLDLHLAMEETRKKVNVEQTSFVMDAALGDPYAQNKLIGGAGNVIVLTIGVRWEGSTRWQMPLLDFDEYLRCHIYLQLAGLPRPGSTDLVGNSFVHLLGRYDQPAEEKIFLSVSGVFVVDSVTSGNIFVTLSGEYRNKSGAPLAFDGQFKVKSRD